MSVSFVLEALVVLGSIVMGTRAGGVGVGLWGGLGTFVLVFIFGEAPGEPPAAAMAIILAVVTTAALMQAAGGIDWMVAVAARVIEKRPKQITLIAPLTAFLFSVGAGTSNIIYPLLPVIYDVSYKNGIRPSRPMSITVVQAGVALAASPVSAAMAAMLTLTDVAPYELGLAQILAITFPACIIGIIVTSLVVNRMGLELADDPEVQARIASGQLAPPGLEGAGAVAGGVGGAGGAGAGGAGGGGESAAAKLTYTEAGRNSAIAFLLGVVAIVAFGIFPGLRPSFEVGGKTSSVDMTSTIVLVMFVVGVLILFIGKPTVGTVPSQSVFKAGMISAIALYGIAWPELHRFSGSSSGGWLGCRRGSRGGL
jgi:anaerobic C4-dicarboxylate transporter